MRATSAFVYFELKDAQTMESIKYDTEAMANIAIEYNQHEKFLMQNMDS